MSEDHVGRTLRTRRWKYEVEAPGASGWDEMNSSRYRELHLYDLAADPWELTDLVGAAEYAEVRTELRERLLTRMVAAGEARPEILPA